MGGREEMHRIVKREKREWEWISTILGEDWLTEWADLASRDKSTSINPYLSPSLERKWRKELKMNQTQAQLLSLKHTTHNIGNSLLSLTLSVLYSFTSISLTRAPTRNSYLIPSLPFFVSFPINLDVMWVRFKQWKWTTNQKKMRVKEWK